MATPFPDDERLATSERRQKYNAAFCRARVMIECAIGRLKAKFPGLRNGLRFRSLSLSSKAIQVKLHSL